MLEMMGSVCMCGGCRRRAAVQWACRGLNDGYGTTGLYSSSIMASNVFGTCITNEYLSKMEKYQGQTTFTRQDRAKVAMESRYSEGKDEAARNFITRRGMFVIKEKVKESQVSTMCLYYNATGSAVRLYDQKSYEGRIWEFPVPSIIGNGQWGAFLCYDIYGCKTVLSYAGKNIQGQDVHWTTAFSVRISDGSAVAADIQLIPSDARHGNNKSDYASLLDRLYNRRRSDTLENNNGASLFASLGDTTTPMLETIMTLPGILDD